MGIDVTLKRDTSIKTKIGIKIKFETSSAKTYLKSNSLSLRFKNGIWANMLNNNIAKKSEIKGSNRFFKSPNDKPKTAPQIKKII